MIGHMIRFFKKKGEPPKQAEPLRASVMLYSPEYDFEAFINRFESNWAFDMEPYVEAGSLSFIVQGMTVSCLFFPEPISDPSLQEDAHNNFLWPDAQAPVASHTAYIAVFVTAIKDRNSIETHCMLSKVLSSLLDTDNGVGVFLAPGVIEKNYYIKTAEVLTRYQLPTELWVHVDAKQEPESVSFVTCGMKKFHKNEFEILNTKKNFIESYYYLKEIIAYTISNDVSFADGDTIGPDEQNKSTIEVSDGILTSGISIKIEH